MPEIKICIYCRKPIKKEVDDYVVVAKETARDPEVIMHLRCKESAPASVQIAPARKFV